MGDKTPSRKILIVEDEPSIRNILYVLLAGLGCEGDIATSGQQALAKISRDLFDAVLLDLRCRNLQAEEVVSQIREIRPSLVGRVLVITGEVADAATLDLIERNCLVSVTRNHIQHDLLEHLRAIFRIPPPPKRVP